MGMGLIVGLAGWWFSGQVGAMSEKKDIKKGGVVQVRLMTQDGKAEVQ